PRAAALVHLGAGQRGGGPAGDRRHRGPPVGGAAAALPAPLPGRRAGGGPAGVRLRGLCCLPMSERPIGEDPRGPAEQSPWAPRSGRARRSRSGLLPAISDETVKDPRSTSLRPAVRAAYPPVVFGALTASRGRLTPGKTGRLDEQE